ncbi:uncharacterized protein At4g18490 isoform X2 [Ziziphus jujuba]|uniref:Uncharacterized protein At4g18490 isoform X2 n=1 Tax=Ziziphus jujuba TaxID=326968 RepID=A0ABM3I7M6_ZIZJJ|nr:uncharacterized protein At4g18490 isoform X2 [Ziziphus jujuba]
MGEAEKGTSSVNPKKKNTLLDDDIGKEFLSSWKSMSVTEDDAMDFSFNTISKGKKKTFNFENLDANFNLDGEFGKLSSFKVDMSDFDLSCSPQKVAKPKERSEGKSASGNRQGKQDPFGFSFDFNELDSFNFEPCLMKEEKNLNKNQSSKKEVSSDGIRGKGSRSNLIEGVGGVDDTITMELAASKSVPASKVESLGSGHASSMKDDCAAKIETSGNLINTRSSPENKAINNSEEERGQQSHFYESALSTELCAHPAMLHFPGQTPVQINSNRNAVPEGETEIFPGGTKLHITTSQKEDTNVNMMVGVGSHQENMTMRNSSVPHVTTSGSNNVGRNQSGSEISIGAVDDAKSTEDDLDIEDNSTSCDSRKATHDNEDHEENQNLTSKPPSAQLGRGMVLDIQMKNNQEFQIISDPVFDKLMLLNENEPRGFCSNALKKSNGSKPLLHQSSSFEIKSLSSGIRSTCPMKISAAAENGDHKNANDAQIGSRLCGNPVSIETESTKRKDILRGSEKNVQDHSNIKEGFNSDGLPSGCKLVGNSQSQLHYMEVTKREPIMLGHELKVKEQNPLGFQVSSSEKTNSSNQRSVNPKLLFSRTESTQKSNIISVEGSKPSPVEAGIVESDFSTWKLSKTLEGASKVSSNSKALKETNSQLSSEKNKNIQSHTAMDTNHPVNITENLLQLNLSLKRKANELPDADLVSLKPLKRLTKLHCESSDSKPLPGVVEEKVCIHENKVEHPTSELGSPQKVNVMELEISSLLENDGNVKKAEAYTKELEDICNMLKRKHEEAKEILLRAVVNNNKLLMLNHPIYEVKIRKVQKFAAELMSKELKA